VADDEEEGVHHHSRVRVQRLTRVPQPVFLPAIISLSAAACPLAAIISWSLSSFLQLSAYQLQPVFLSAIISLSAEACLPSCNYQRISCSLSSFLQLSAYQLQLVFLPTIISLSAAACLPSCNYQPISCSLPSFLQLSANQLQPAFLPAIISLSAAAFPLACNISWNLAFFLQLSDCSRNLSSAIISPLAAACLTSCKYQPISCSSLSSFLQLSANQLQPVFLPAFISLSAAGCPLACNYQLTQPFFWNYQLSAAAFPPSSNYQPQPVSFVTISVYLL
jgi:hypothetical protein